jgi:hypothetical protein
VWLLQQLLHLTVILGIIEQCMHNSLLLLAGGCNTINTEQLSTDQLSLQLYKLSVSSFHSLKHDQLTIMSARKA